MNAVFKTNMGDIEIKLNIIDAPLTVDNFIYYVKSGYYANTIFHRVIMGFMIQGGGLDKEMKNKKTTKTIINEADNGLKNERGTIAMARTAEPHSATSQFFINLVDNDFLNFSAKTPEGWGYAVFGKVTKGMDNVDQISQIATHDYDVHQNVPKQPVIINSAHIE